MVVKDVANIALSHRQSFQLSLLDAKFNGKVKN